MNLKYLIETLNKPNTNLLAVKYYLKRFYEPELMKQISNVQTKKYVKQKIFDNNKFEIKLIKWSPYSYAPIHDHADNGCVFMSYSDGLQETCYDKSFNVVSKKVYNKLSIGFIENTNYHSMINITDKDIYSMHIYSPSNYKCNFYRP